MKRAMTFLLICAALCLPGAQAIELDDCRVSYCEEYVTLRAEPSTDAEALTTIPYGERVTDVSCDDYEDRFYRCTYNGFTGYVLSEYLLGGQEMADIEGAHVDHCDEWVSLRARPHTDSEQLMKVPKGEALDDAYYVENDFVHCICQGVEGYILARYVEYGIE